jgi:hypothetical protein
MLAAGRGIAGVHRFVAYMRAALGPGPKTAAIVSMSEGDVLEQNSACAPTHAAFLSGRRAAVLWARLIYYNAEETDSDFNGRRPPPRTSQTGHSNSRFVATRISLRPALLR